MSDPVAGGSDGPRAAAPAWWRARAARERPQPLLLLDAEVEAVLAAAVDVACRLVPRGGFLHVLATVRLPLAVSLDAPPGEETAQMAALLHEVERMAGRRGVTVRGHLRRGRHVRTMLQAALAEFGPDVVVCFGALPRLAELTADTGQATAVLVPLRDDRS